jgi:putative oxidoreductase
MAAMSNPFVKLEPMAYAALRIVAGLMFAIHGTQKLFGWPPADHPPPEQFSQVWIGGVLELVGGVLVAVGLFTPWAAFILSGMMAVAYFQFHWKGAMDGLKWLPIVNKGEPAVLYCFLFLFIAGRGGGPYSADAKR